MDRKEAISRAKDQLISDRDANAMLNREGLVRVMPMLSYYGTEPSDGSNKSPDLTVTFTIEDHEVWGKRLMAEFQGVKEFAA